MELVVVVLLALLASAVQLTVPFAWVPLDLTVLFFVFVGLARGGGYGTACGILCGLIMDSLAGPVFGIYTLAGAAAGGMADLLHAHFNQEQVFAQVMTMAALTLVRDLTLWQAAEWSGLPQLSLARFFAGFALPKILVHALLAAPVFFLLKRLVRPSGRGRFRRVPKMIRTLPG